MSTVYKVEDLTLQSYWAMKETMDIFPNKDKSEIIDQFQKEARILANLSHPGLPRVIDYFKENGNHYLVEELIYGRPSIDLLEESPAFDELRILRWAIQICELLEFLHGHNIIYRDLKPGNIMVDSEERVYLVDFGIARFFQGGKNRDTVIIGTPGFASPEHYGRGQTDRRSDIYGLGATMHYMLTGNDPAENPFHFEIPYVLNPDASFRTSAVVMKCLEMDPNRRYQNAREVRDAIEKTAIPDLKKRTRSLRPVQYADTVGRYRNTTDFFGMATQFLSYLSVFPLSMGISGAGALLLSMINPVIGLGTGIITFPILCMEFWKRLEKVYADQDVLIKTEREGISYKSRKLNINTRWLEIFELRVVKNQDRLFGRKVKEIRVTSRAGEFAFDPGFHNYRRLVDVIVTHGGLSLVEDNMNYSVYKKL